MPASCKRATDGPDATQKSPRCGLFQCSEKTGECLSALDLTSLHAVGADVSLANMALCVLDGNLLHVRTEGTVGHAVGVADATTSRGGLTANFTNLGHFNQLHLQYKIGVTRLGHKSLSTIPQQTKWIQELFVDNRLTVHGTKLRALCPCVILL